MKKNFKNTPLFRIPNKGDGKYCKTTEKINKKGWTTILENYIVKIWYTAIQPVITQINIKKPCQITFFNTANIQKLF